MIVLSLGVPLICEALWFRSIGEGGKKGRVCGKLEGSSMLAMRGCLVEGDQSFQ